MVRPSARDGFVDFDLLTVHCMVDAGTRGLRGEAELAQMRQAAYVLNLARARVVDGNALFGAVKPGHLTGAAPDVFSREPAQLDGRFFKLRNVLAVPHVGGATVGVVRNQSEMVVDSTEQHLARKRPRNVWNPEVPHRDSGGPAS